MSLFTDHNFIAQISSRLSLFKRKNQKTYNFRCPICGDSQKNKTKKRAYFYQKKNDFFFRCHNCGIGLTLGNFIKQLDPTIYQAYIFERYKNGENGHSNFKKPNFDDFKVKTEFPTPKTQEQIKIENEIWDVPISEYLSNHPAKKYLLDRKIPLEFFSQLFYTKNFKEFVGQFETEDTFELPEDARIIIPFFDKDKELVAFQGRALGTSKLRYITIKLKKDAPKIFGMDKVDPDRTLYILEGPFDSMFLPHAIATAGASLDHDSLKEIRDKVFVYDNEPRSPEIIKQMIKVVEAKENIVVWPDTIKEKDINAMVLAGLTPDNIMDIIENNVYGGIKARLKIAEWRRS